jgi:hypothetical protein
MSRDQHVEQVSTLRFAANVDLIRPEAVLCRNSDGLAPSGHKNSRRLRLRQGPSYLLYTS